MDINSENALVKLSKQLLQIKDGFALIPFTLLPRPENCQPENCHGRGALEKSIGL